MPETAEPIEPADLAFLFASCLAPKKGVSESEYQSAAAALGVETEAIKAVAAVETAGASFEREGRPKILFERHYFHKLTHGQYDAAAPNISDRKAGGYGKSAAQYGRLEAAFALKSEEALLSASWGRFQIMGARYKEAGFRSVEEMVLAMTQSESAHLDAFVSFVQSDERLQKALQNKDWAGFARIYNGKGYAKNKYDTKMREHYDALKKSSAQHPSTLP
jgi:hypothetical protein